MNLVITKPEWYCTVALSTPCMQTLAVHKEDRGPWKLSVYAPYWIINKTHFTLEYSVPSSLVGGRVVWSSTPASGSPAPWL